MKVTELPKIIAICGTNASGKSSLGIELAYLYNGEIISADSRQVFRGFDLCSGKISIEEQEKVKHYLIDVRNVGDKYSVSDFQRDAYSSIEKILKNNKKPFIVGGTGLFISSVVYGYNFEYEKIDYAFRAQLEKKPLEELKAMLNDDAKEYFKGRISDSNNKRRIIRAIEKIRNGIDIFPSNTPKYNVLKLGVTWPKDILHRRIDERLHSRIEQGMIEEVKRFLDAGNDPSIMYDLGLEYRHIMWYLTGKYKSFDEFYTELSNSIKKFAKRQMTWFRRDKSIKWIDMENDYIKQSTDLIDRFLIDNR